MAWVEGYCIVCGCKRVPVKGELIESLKGLFFGQYETKCLNPECETNKPKKVTPLCKICGHAHI